jgi:glycosyltransferase involved in cell wall biosynthesis
MDHSEDFSYSSRTGEATTISEACQQLTLEGEGLTAYYGSAIVLHIDTERGWRGGENQLRLLCEGLQGGRFTSHLALDPRGEAHRRLHHKFPTLSVTMHGGADVFAALKIARYCRTHGITVIDSHTSNAHAIALLAKIIAPTLKLVVHRRADFRPNDTWINRKKYHSKLVDCFVAISQAIGQNLRSFGVSEDKIAVVPSAVDPSPYQKIDRQRERDDLAKALGINPDVSLIGAASALTYEKGHDTLLRSLALLKASGRKFHCVIAGDGALAGDLESLRAQLGLAQDVTYIGRIVKVAEFLSALDILVMPSRTEGLGTILLEGIYAGCAVVASNAGGIPEVIEHGTGGLIFPVDDFAAMAAHLERLLADRNLQQTLNEGARARALAQFSLSAMVAGNEAIYGRVLNSGDQSRLNAAGRT